MINNGGRSVLEYCSVASSLSPDGGVDFVSYMDFEVLE